MDYNNSGDHSYTRTEDQTENHNNTTNNNYIKTHSRIKDHIHSDDNNYMNNIDYLDDDQSSDYSYSNDDNYSSNVVCSGKDSHSSTYIYSSKQSLSNEDSNKYSEDLNPSENYDHSDKQTQGNSSYRENQAQGNNGHGERQTQVNSGQNENHACEHGGHNQYKHHKKKSRNIAGKLLSVVFLAVGLAFVGITWNAGLLPIKFILIIAVAVLVGFGFLILLATRRSKAPRIIGIVLSIILSIVLVAGLMLVHKANTAIEEISGITYKVDNMIVVVRTDDPAQNLLEAEGYSMAIQTAIDQENTSSMIQQIEVALDEEIVPLEYDNVTDMAQALLDQEVDAIIYNQAIEGLITDQIEGYRDQVRTLYQYGFETEIETAIEQNVELESNGSFNLYISGIDVEGDISTTSRSDVNIIATVNPTTHHILLTTTPRDYYVVFPGVSGTQRDKLTHAGIYGVNVSMDTLAELYDTSIPYFMRVNFTGFKEIINILGGIEVESEYEFDAGEYHFVQGTNYLDGDAALAFVRERHAFQTGDNQRGKNQEAVITAVFQKVTSPAVIGSAFSLLDQVSGFIQTNMSGDDIAKLINDQIASGEAWTIESQAVTGEGTMHGITYSYPSSELYVMYPNEDSVAQATEKIHSVLSEMSR